ncbi:PIR protein [Plasmodium ovale]|uniref:PIR protein n=1 Tax=Plasmodium ovale TaxID=36330 RepID=A0A1D3JF45_PLAOA|nr:PIR protein [Plasmodium ovale]
MSSRFLFFNDFKTYKSYERVMEIKFSGDKDNTTCESFSSGVQNFGDEDANDICVKFKILYNSIKSKKKSSESNSLNDIDFAYLNYWLNIRSRNTTIIYGLSVDDFQEKIGHVEYEFINDDFDEKLYDIDENVFKNMNLLNYLYDNYGIIFNNFSSNKKKEKISCLQYAQEFINNYKKCIIQCPLDDTNFCKALKHFKKEYDEIFFTEGSITEKCIDQELLKLPTYKDVSTEHKIAVFTPFRQWIRAKIRRNQGEDSKLFEENDPSFLDISDNEHISFDQNPYNISYDSVVNS